MISVGSFQVDIAISYSKVILRGTSSNERAIAWIAQNSQEATGKQLALPTKSN